MRATVLVAFIEPSQVVTTQSQLPAIQGMTGFITADFVVAPFRPAPLPTATPLRRHW